MKRKIMIAIIICLSIIFISPILVTVVKSLQYENKIITLKQYGEFFITNHTAMRYFWNSMIYSILITIVCIIVTFPLGFLFAKVNFPGRNSIFFIFIIVMLLPFQATLLSNYIQLRDFKLLNTPYALLLPMMFSPFAVFLFRQFIINIPNELLEYTTLDTSSVLQLFIYVVIPQIKHAIVALAILIFCESWNMVEQAIIFASESPEILPLSVVLTKLPPDVIFAGATVYLYPILLIFILFHDTFQKSMEKFRW